MRIGILGAGDMAATHVTAYKQIPEVEVAGIVGRHKDKVEEVAGRLGVPGFTDPWTLLNDDTIEAIDITYPSSIHREYALAVLETGKHVFCETPIALNLEDAEAMSNAARANKRLLMVALLMRFVNHNQYIHDKVVSGGIGLPQVSYAHRLSSSLAWVNRPAEVYGDPVVEMMIHDFDMLNWLFGMPRVVSGTALQTVDGVPAHVFATLDYGGHIALVEGSAIMPGTYPFSTSLRVVGNKAAIETRFRFSGIPGDPLTDEVPESELTFYPRSGAAEEPTVVGVDPYQAECEYFVKCVRGEANASLLDAEAGTSALRIALAVRESLERPGKLVQLT